MQKSFYIKSAKGNCYHFDTFNGQFALIHPVLYKIDKLYKDGIDKTEITERLSNEYVGIDINYYLNYYSWIENNIPAVEEDYTKELTPDMVEFALSNLNQLTFEVTDACNLKCKYCGYGELYDNYDKRTNKYMSVDTAKRLLDYLSAYWNNSNNISITEPLFISFYGGEPLLNMTFIKGVVDIIEHLDCKRKFIFTMTTNAMLLDKHIDYLKEHKFRILISLDGNKKNNGYRVTPTGKESFDIVYGNVKKVQKKYPEYFNNNVNFNSVIHNKNNADDIASFIKDEFNKTPSIGELNTNGIKENMKEKFIHVFNDLQQSIETSADKKSLEKNLFLTDPLAHYFILFTHKYNHMTYDNYNDMFGKGRMKLTPTGTCIPFSRKMFVTVNGKILPCERTGQIHSLGEITDSEVVMDIKDICRKYNEWYSHVTGQCKKCYGRRTCQQCIFNLNDIDGKPKCLGFTDKKGFESSLVRMVDYMESSRYAYKKTMKEVIMR